MPVREHMGQHGDDCWGCKLQSLSFVRSGPKPHMKNGSHWDGNPVVDRITELSGKTVDTDAIERAGREGRPIQDTLETE